MSPLNHQGLILVLMWISATRFASSKSPKIYILTTPQADNLEPFKTCVRFEECERDNSTGLLMRETSGHPKCEDFPTKCTSRVENVFNARIVDQSHIINARLNSPKGNLFDVYKPLPSKCFGYTYMIISLTPHVGYKPHSTNYLELYNPTIKLMKLTATIPDNFLLRDFDVRGNVKAKKRTFEILIPAQSTSYILTKVWRLDGVVLHSLDKFSVLQGVWETRTKILDDKVYHQVEMIPPLEFYDKVYVLPLPKMMARALVKIVAIKPSTILTVEEDRATGPIKKKIPLRGGSVWSYKQESSIVVTGDKSFVLMSFFSRTESFKLPVMVVMPPMIHWMTYAVIHPIDIPEDQTVVQYVNIALPSKDVASLSFYNLDTKETQTRFFNTRFSNGASGYSFLNFIITHRMFVESTKGKHFQAIQYGIRGERTVYAFTVTINGTCEYTTTSNNPVGDLKYSKAQFDDSSRVTTVVFALLSLALGVGVTTLVVLVVVHKMRKDSGPDDEPNADAEEIEEGTLQYELNAKDSTATPAISNTAEVLPPLV